MKVLEKVSNDHYTLHATLYDLGILAIPRILSALFAIMLSYNSDIAVSDSPYDPYHKTGDKKSKAELEEEALEENFFPKAKRYVSRHAFACEFIVFWTGVLLTMKCLSRLNVEIGLMDEKDPMRPLFWVALATTGFCILMEVSYIDSIEEVALICGQSRRRNHEHGNWMERISHSLTQPLLSAAGSDDEGAVDIEQAPTTEVVDGTRGQSDIGGDANYKAQWSDLIGLCAPDKHLIFLAFIFLVLAALAQIYVPRFTGKVLDALVANSSDTFTDDATNDNGTGGSVLKIPGFVSNVELLIVTSLLGGIFGGIRGAIFTIVRMKLAF